VPASGSHGRCERHRSCWTAASRCCLCIRNSSPRRRGCSRSVGAGGVPEILNYRVNAQTTGLATSCAQNDSPLAYCSLRTPASTHASRRIRRVSVGSSRTRRGDRVQIDYFPIQLNQASAQGREWEVSLEDCVLRPTETCKVAEDVPVAAEKVRVRDFSAGIRPKPVEMRTGLTPQPPLCVCDPLADVKYYSNGR